MLYQSQLFVYLLNASTRKSAGSVCTTRAGYFPRCMVKCRIQRLTLEQRKGVLGSLCTYKALSPPKPYWLKGVSTEQHETML